ncbi:hypothetical protein C8A05DRAFT_31102 [Staphylotrichum tortipilum]|uniref:Uncharacterized protein n=1 Tax=Staphylotrichum tortipilum TaxID=2831512 RepID=A0AAN6RWW0_9PEZI|nr:hypothetical protein C8A05DRAFT_31102 [Staphylotrichum longicolle]
MPRPRPKRTRVAPARPAEAPTPEAQPQSSATLPLATKPAIAVPAVPSSDIYDVSDREKERIKQRVAETAKAAEAQAATTTRRTRASQLNLNSDQARALDDSSRRRDEAMNKLDDLSSTSRPEQPESPALVPGQRESVTRMQPRLTDASGLDLDDELFANLDDSLDDSQHASEATQTGYRSTDTSSFNIAMFKRRPRQSSVAGRDDGPIRPSSRGQNTPSISTTLNFGNFRRRAREPSILGTARKPRTQRSVSRASQASRNASVLGDGDDSGPDGESTPLDKRRQTRGSPTDANVRDGSPTLPSRKRKSLESHQDGREKRAAVEAEAAEEDDPEEIHQSIELDIEVERTPSPPRGRALERDRFSTPVQEDDPDMAPPLSSSSEADSPVAWPSLDTLAHRTYNTRRAPPAVAAARTPEPRDSSELSSPPSLTHSPNYTAAAAKPAPKKKTAPPQKKVTTADLTSLLPRRRIKASNRVSSGSNDPFDLASSDAEDRYDVAAVEDDEPSYVDSRAARRRKQQPLSKTVSNRRAKAPAGGAKKRGVRTYGAQEDKENGEVAEEIVVGSGEEEEQGGEDEEEEELPEAETSQLMRERIGEELQKAVKKFKEVDQWELSFEEVVQGSSPGPDAR